MANLIIIRLHPDQPISGSAFKDHLNGLTISAYDLSCADPKTGNLVGTATYIPPPSATTTIFQHLDSNNQSEAVATAVIEIGPIVNEYVTRDLHIALSWSGSPAVFDNNLFYDVQTVSHAWPITPSSFPTTFTDSDVGLYLTIPRPVATDVASLNLSDDGSLPNYQLLAGAIQKVLKGDLQPAPPATIGTLTADQARHIAYEIVWGPQQDPLPLPPATTISGPISYDTLGALYSDPPNDGNIVSNTAEQNRQQFEGNLSAYYAIHNAKADRLARYVYALSCAVACHTLSANATSALLQFPVPPSGVMTTISNAEVLLFVTPPGSPLSPSFQVPAEYFYVLGANLPTQTGIAQRFSLACGDSQEHMLPILTAAYDVGTINPAMNPAQAARILNALAPATKTGIAQCNEANVDVAGLVTNWLGFPSAANWRTYQPGDDVTGFWPTEFGSTDYLYLVLCAVTDGYLPLINDFRTKFPSVNTAVKLAAVTEAEWESLFTVSAPTNMPAPAKVLSFSAPEAAKILQTFTPLSVMLVSGNGIANPTQVTPPLISPNVDILPGVLTLVPAGTQITFTNPDLLPPFTSPGSFDVRLSAFIRYVQQFFNMPFGPASVPPAPADAPPFLDLPINDLIAEFASIYMPAHPGWTFGTPLANAGVNAAISAIPEISSDPAAQSWLNQRVHVINELCLLTGVVSNPILQPPTLDFSVAEALYARGFTSAQDINSLSFPDFEAALRGTVAFTQSLPIYTKAGGTNFTPTPPPTGPFQPINPGSLVNCIPPCYLSPLGPVEYLHELLKLSEASTCKKPFHPPPLGHKTLGAMIAGGRRGPLGNLAVTAANAETQLPLIDIVNENLENLAAILPALPVGVVYDTATHKLSGYTLCAPDSKHSDGCHQPDRLFEALPEHSSPAVPVGQPGAYDKLKWDFSAPTLPYSQPLDICRTYLDHFGTCRFEAMRTFHEEITEFTLDPSLSTPPFQSHLWRYPVRIDIAIEYLQLNPEEYDLLFIKDIMLAPTPKHLVLCELYGFNYPPPTNWVNIVLLLPEFLKRTGLTYCELVELQKSGCFKFVVEPVREGDHKPEEHGKGMLPDCEPCCLEHFRIQFLKPANQEDALRELVVYLRLWRKLQKVCGARYTFPQLCDICEVLQLFKGGNINPDFIRQLVAFQILRDQLRLKLSDGTSPPGSHGADRTHLLALWVGPGATKWDWAVSQLLDQVQHYAKQRHDCHERKPHFVKLLRVNLEPLSILAGFNPALTTDTWHAKPTHTLRFAEILAKIYASDFGVGEILYLFTANNHLDGDDPFPLQETNEALDKPLGLPDDEHDHDLWALRKKLLSVEVTEEEVRQWTWHRIDASLRNEFGYEVPLGGTDYLTSLGQHFFPTILEHSGLSVATKDRQYRVNLAASSPDMWNIPLDGPFRYDTVASQLWTQIPLRDKAVVEKLEHLRNLNGAEPHVVQNLYFMPRVDLASFACLFPDFSSAERHLIEEPEEMERWEWFRRHFAMAHKRCHIIAAHLVKHVAAATECEWERAHATAWLVLKSLFADENRAKTTWEADSGDMPDLTWKPLPSGGAFAALLGLTGTGLFGEFTHGNGSLAWREVRGPMTAFGHERNGHNAPVPTVLPAMDLTLSPDQLKFVELRNGFAISDKHGRELGGAESFHVHWSGVLLVDEEGRYEFTAGAPTAEGEEPDFERIEHCRWRVTLARGQKEWIVLSHHWHGEHGQIESRLALKCGAYGIVVEFVQPTPNFFGVDDIYPQHTGFQLKYTGPDTGCRHETLPLRRLYRDKKDDTLYPCKDLQKDNSAALFLDLYYTSSLRDMRRTYQRAFKALLFAHRFELSGHSLLPYRQSELGYMLDHADLFAGVSYYRHPSAFSRHAADFDFNFLPLKDTYHPPSAAQDQRVQPLPKREQALFDWWERIFDYTRMRRDREKAIERPVWLLFEEALEQQPDNPAQLVRHLGVDLDHADLVLSYFQSMNLAVYPVSATDLEDDRWAIRIWHSDRWVRDLLCHFYPKDIRNARPDLWSSEDPGTLVLFGETETGDFNLSHFLCDGCFDNGEPRRYADVKQLNDGLRERARSALLAYLCGMNRVPLPWGGLAKSAKDISALLFLDVEAGLCERASRIEEAVTAVQNFIQRARLGVELDAVSKPIWIITAEFVRLWKHEFEIYRIWEKCKCRKLYKENWIDWDELSKARKIEAFQFLEAELRRSTLTIAVPGGLEYWPETLPPVHPAVKLLQKREPSALRLLNPSREGLGVLGTPERDARPSWLAPDIGKGQRGFPPDENAGLAVPLVLSDVEKFPFWIQAAIRLGIKFIRVAAGGMPPAAAEFHPTDFHEEPGCCNECGCVHPPLVDEYYFWLVASKVFNAVVQNEYYDPTLQESTLWHDPNNLPKLLDWKSAPAARLAWCRVHNGEFKQPRRSDDAVQLTPGIVPDLIYIGRVADSLKFSVTGGIAPVGYFGSDAPGFRYDLATDFSVALPLVEDPLPVPSQFPAGLPVYPYFVFVEPGDRLFPDSIYAPAVAVAGVLRCHCRFESALKWYQLYLNPLEADNTWVHCSHDTQPPPPPPLRIDDDSHSHRKHGRHHNAENISSEYTVDISVETEEPPIVLPLPPEMCCDSTHISAAVARNRAMLLHYLDTLVEWSHALMRQNSRESAQQARLILDTAARILGPCPRSVINHELPKHETVTTFKPLIPPLNPRLMELYCHVRDGLGLVHRCLSDARLRNTTKECRAPYWGQDPCHCGPIKHQCGCESINEACCDEDDWCHPHSPYRFVFLLQKAQEATTKVRELGSALMSAFERGDAEYLASMRARHETQLADLTIKVRKDQWRDADWQVKALGKTKEISQTNWRYYKGLIQAGLNAGELGYQSNMELSIGLRSAAIPTEVAGEAMRLVPDIYVGTSGVNFKLPPGTKMGDMLETIARVMNETADVAGITASLDLTQAGWQRRLDEWVHQVDVLGIEIEQIEIQILGAERRMNEALEELNIQRRQLEQSREVLDFLSDKFTSHELYLYLQKETAALYSRMFALARHLALEAQRAFNFELGYSKRNFLACEDWDTLHEGLLAGERLQLALQRMDTEYVDCNRREYELTKHFSLALHFPLQFLRLKITGCCEIDIPEWMFDMDYPGQYMRRIKNVSLTIPCVTGPYTGVHCRLTLLSSRTRIDPCLPCPVTECCHERRVGPCGCRHEPHEHYEACCGDQRVVKHYGAREAIATSTGRNDSGLFELNFRDERHLPFEFFGAASCWRIEMPQENNYFDMDSLTDVVMHMNYTAREGGDALRDAARASTRKKLPGNGWIYIDLRKDYPDAWELFQRSRKQGKSKRSMTVKVTRKLFPFLPTDPEIRITKLAILFETEKCCGHSCPEIRGCPCAHENICGSHLVEVTVDRPDDDRDDTREVEIECVSSAEWPKLFHGVGEVKISPIDRRHESHSLTLTFENHVCELARAFLLCRYEVIDECCETMLPIIRETHDC